MAVDGPEARSATEQEGVPDQDHDTAMSQDAPQQPADPVAPGAAAEDDHAQEPGGGESGGESGPTLAGVRRPGSPLGWAAFPFAVAWRFLFPKKSRPFLVELPFLIVFALILAFLIKTFLLQAFSIPSGSMQNTLAINDRVLVNRVSVWTGAQPQRGEIVVFQDPGGWLDNADSPQPSGNWLTSALTWIGVLPANDGDLIKRVIGVPGDHVACCNAKGDVTVNGVALTEPYLYPGDSPGSGENGMFSVTVPPGHLWVMGDHRGISVDSRAHQQLDGGFVPIKNVVGQAFVIIWPPSRWRSLPVPTTFHQAGLSALATPGAIPAAAFTLALPMTMIRRRHRFADVRKPRARRAIFRRRS